MRVHRRLRERGEDGGGVLPHLLAGGVEREQEEAAVLGQPEVAPADGGAPWRGNRRRQAHDRDIARVRHECAPDEVGRDPHSWT